MLGTFGTFRKSSEAASDLTLDLNKHRVFNSGSCALIAWYDFTDLTTMYKSNTEKVDGHGDGLYKIQNKAVPHTGLTKRAGEFLMQTNASKRPLVGIQKESYEGIGASFIGANRYLEGDTVNGPADSPRFSATQLDIRNHTVACVYKNTAAVGSAGARGRLVWDLHSSNKGRRLHELATDDKLDDVALIGRKLFHLNGWADTSTNLTISLHTCYQTASNDYIEASINGVKNGAAWDGTAVSMTGAIDWTDNREATNGITLGIDINRNGTLNFEGRIYEFIILSRALTKEEAAELTGYLTRKHGKTIQG